MPPSGAKPSQDKVDPALPRRGDGRSSGRQPLITRRGVIAEPAHGVARTEMPMAVLHHAGQRCVRAFSLRSCLSSAMNWSYM
jgi:hypothetical protein